MYNFFPERQCFVIVSTVKEESFNEKVTSLADLNKNIFKFSQKDRFEPFLATVVHIQRRFF